LPPHPPADRNGMRTLSVELGERSYPIHIGSGLLADGGALREALGADRAAVITNDVVAPLYLDRLLAAVGADRATPIILPDGERHKTLATAAGIYDQLMAGAFDRKSVLIALGGGVVGDIAGFAAATWLRGVRHIQIPTTLLAQVDSSVGGKTGVNHPLGKNMIGAFHQPDCVIADMAVLKTLPKREVRAGLAEVLKYGLIDDAEFFDWLAGRARGLLALEDGLLAEAVARCCRAKADIVARDERESGVRALLNLGHTFAHAIEAATGYGVWLHGEAVATGMVMAADLSRRLGWLEADQARRIRDVLETDFGMPVIPPADISTDRFLELMASDKKVERGRIRFVLLRGLGRAVIVDSVDPAVLAQTLAARAELCH